MLPSIYQSVPLMYRYSGVLLYLAVLLLLRLFQFARQSLGSSHNSLLHSAAHRESLLSVWEDTAESQWALGDFPVLHSRPGPANLQYFLTGDYFARQIFPGQIFL